MSRSDDEVGVGEGTAPSATRSGEGPTPVRPRERAPDDSDLGWGERPEDRDDDRRWLEDRPPHWGSD